MCHISPPLNIIQVKPGAPKDPRLTRPSVRQKYPDDDWRIPNVDENPIGATSQPLSVVLQAATRMVWSFEEHSVTDQKL